MLKIKTNSITEVAKVLQNMGDSLSNKYYQTEDLKVAQTSIKAYNSAINAIKTQIIYKKLTGTPKNIKNLD